MHPETIPADALPLAIAQAMHDRLAQLLAETQALREQQEAACRQNQLLCAESQALWAESQALGLCLSIDS
jgi:hypothetical protein